jgi:hypothetical protein
MGNLAEKNIIWLQFGESIEEARRLLWDNIDLSAPENAYAKWENSSEEAAKAAVQRDYTQIPLLKFYTSVSALSQEISQPDVRKWMQYGLCRRFGSIHHNFSELTSIIHEHRRGPLATEEGFRVSDAVSLLYLHSSAVFDALSHAISETLKLGPHRSQLDIDIAREKFRRQIADAELREKTNLHSKWLMNTRRSFRHDIAHRIPPYIPTSSLTAEDAQRLKQLDELYSTALKDQRLDDATKLHDQKREVGQLAPIIITDVDGSFRFIYPTITEHLLQTIVASGEIIEILLTKYELFE